MELLTAGDALHPKTRSRAAPPHSPDGRKRAQGNMPVDLNGYWKMISNEHFEDYMKALGEFTESFVEVDESLVCQW